MLKATCRRNVNYVHFLAPKYAQLNFPAKTISLIRSLAIKIHLIKIFSGHGRNFLIYFRKFVLCNHQICYKLLYYRSNVGAIDKNKYVPKCFLKRLKSFCFLHVYFFDVIH